MTKSDTIYQLRKKLCEVMCERDRLRHQLTAAQETNRRMERALAERRKERHAGVEARLSAGLRPIETSEALAFAGASQQQGV